MSVPKTPFKHVVVMMFENRSFDSMLGFLHENKKSALTNQPFEGLTGDEYNLNRDDVKVPVFKIKSTDVDAYHMPRKDPGEGFANTNFQLFGAAEKPFPKEFTPNSGFVIDYEHQIKNTNLEDAEKAANAGENVPKIFTQYAPDLLGVHESDIMGIYTPESLPVLSHLAKYYAVCDHWYCSAPTETLPNRAFTHFGTSDGNLYDEVHSYGGTSIFMHLANHGKSWGIFGNNGKPYTVGFCQDIPSATAVKNGTTKTQSLPQDCKVGSFDDFVTALETRTLPDYTFLEPIWGKDGNSQHPNYNVAEGEQYLLQIYNAVKSSTYWEDTLLIITYDEHGGCYDHVTPPEGAASPAVSKAFGFEFDRFGVRVPAVLISPWIEAGTVHRTKGKVPIDHTSILATLEEMFDLPALTARDSVAPHLLDVATLTEARTDDPLHGVVAPVSHSSLTIEDHASQIQQMHAAALTDKHNRETGENLKTPSFKTQAEVNSYIDHYHNRYYSYGDQ
jgi:phospholipase C